MARLILYSLLAGVVGTGLGGFISILLKRNNENFMTYLLNFAGGMMISITCFKLIPEAEALSNIYITLASVLSGSILIQMLNKYIDYIEEKKKCKKMHSNLQELVHSNKFIKEFKHSRQHSIKGDYNDSCILRAGFIMLFAIALHNLPEGLAIGSSGAYNAQIGFVLALTIAFHNVPEGMAIAVPLIIGGFNKWKTVLMTAASGFTTVIGAIIGYLIGGISNLVAAFAMAFAGGAMIYVTFGEIMPQAILMCNNRKSVVYMLIGFVIGMVVMFLT